MSKSILIIDTPKSCEQCPCCVHIIGKKYCAAKGVYLGRNDRDCSCPLVAVPAKQDYSQSKGIAMASYIEGWNDCINKLFGKE